MRRTQPVGLLLAHLTLVLVSAFIGCSALQGAQASDPDRETLLVFLVRHGEKAESSSDPELTTAGHERAEELARTLQDARVEHVHSSDFLRTKSTASPTALDHELSLELYDPSDLPSLVEKVRAQGGRHLIVGHSGTTPRMVKLLGGDPGSEIDEAGEFDRLYVVSVQVGRGVHSVMLRYGQPSIEAPRD